MSSIPPYAWTAPPWTGAEQAPVLYDDCEELLFCAALLEQALPQLGDEPTAEQLAARIGRFLTCVSDHLAEVRLGLRAARRVSDLEEEVHRRAMQGLDHAGKLDERALLALSRARSPAEQCAVLEDALRASGDAGSESVKAIATLVEEHRRAEELSARRLGLLAKDEYEKETLLAEEGSQLVHDVYASVPPPKRMVPYAAPGEPDRGSFELPLPALQICFRFVRALGEVDAFLLRSAKDARASAPSHRSLRDGRAHIVSVLERVASVAEARRAAHEDGHPAAQVPSYKDVLPSHEDVSRLLETQMALVTPQPVC